MEIQVKDGGWGNALATDIQVLLENVADQLLRHLAEPPSGRIIVGYNVNGPVTERRKSPLDDYRIWLVVQNTLWDQFSYQFAHEFCHVICNTDEKQYEKPSQWFHEVICELASIFVLKQMADNWRTAPPYPNWSDYAPHLDKYAQDIIDSVERPPEEVGGLKDWLREYEPILRQDPYQKIKYPERKLHKIAAVELLPLFQKSPEHWQSLIYMSSTSESFQKYLAMWHHDTPDKHKSFVVQIASIFGFSIS